MVEIFRGQARRRWSEEDKRRLVAETFGPGATVHGVARRHGVSPSQLFAWRKLVWGFACQAILIGTLSPVGLSMGFGLPR